MEHRNIFLARPFNYESAKNYVTSMQLTSFVLSIIYIIVIFSIKSWMTKRQPYKLATSLNIWNGALAAFSIAGAIVTTPAMFSEIGRHGFVGKSI
jgi:hypothetical protein